MSWWGSHSAWLGVEEYDGAGNPTYCIEAGKIWKGDSGNWTTVTDDTHLTAAWLVDKHKADHSSATQAAVAYALHEHVENTASGESHWGTVKTVGLEGADINAIAGNAAQLWADAENTRPANIDASYKYTNAQRKGAVAVGIKGANGYVSGIPYTVTLSGPAIFDATGTQTANGTTSNSKQDLAWTATGNGNVTWRFKFSRPTAKVLSQSGGQDLLMPSDPGTVTHDISFQVRRDFQPTATTQTAANRLAIGATPADKVTSGVKSDDQWVAGTPVTFKGYYLVGDSAHVLKTVKRGDNETITAYLERLRRDSGLRQVAAATTTFTNVGQTNTATAKAYTGGFTKSSDIANAPDYTVTAKDAGLFGAGAAQTLATGVDISAKNAAQTGYYVFVYDFLAQ